MFVEEGLARLASLSTPGLELFLGAGELPIEVGLLVFATEVERIVALIPLGKNGVSNELKKKRRMMY